MKKQSDSRTNIDINKLLESFSTKYETLISFLSMSEIEVMFQQAINQLSETPDVNPDFQINFLVEKMFFMKARDEINSGNIDLEILIVDKYLSTAKFMLRQLKYQGEDADKIAEEAVIECIENYEGKEGFKSAILKSIKNILNPSKKEEPIIVSLSEEKVTSKISDVHQMKIDESSAVGQIQPPNQVESNQELIIPNDGLVRNPNQLELLMNGIDILHQVPLDDELYLKFISLKYGYYNNQYFGLDEIASILNISLEMAKKYYFQSLDYVKNWFGLQLDKMYTYYIQN